MAPLLPPPGSPWRISGRALARGAISSLGGISLLLAGCGGVSTTLNGAGASFPAAIYQRWFKDLAAQGVRVNYQSVGSGAGIRQFTAGTIDFGASDVPMTPEAIAAVPRGVLQVPMTAGAIAVAYNHKGCDLKLSRRQLVDVFLGRITNFSQLGCAAKPIRLVHRSDGSGTTANFTAHLAAISPEWAKTLGSGTTVKWPSGVAARGNEGVSAQLLQLDGGLGYVEAAFVREPLQAAALTNAAGQSVRPSQEAEMEALASIDLGPDLIGRNPDPAQGYPIVTFSWVLFYRSGNGDRLDALRKVFDHVLSDKAQAIAPDLGFVSLPASVREKGRAALSTLQK